MPLAGGNRLSAERHNVIGRRKLVICSTSYVISRMKQIICSTSYVIGRRKQVICRTSYVIGRRKLVICRTSRHWQEEGAIQVLLNAFFLGI